MEGGIEMAKCECCGLKEDCTKDYISEVKANFDGKWLCGLCSEAVRDEVNRGKQGNNSKKKMNMMMMKMDMEMEEAVKAHMAFCGKYNKSNPAIRVADGMRQMLMRRRRTSGDLGLPSTPPPSSSSSSSPVSISKKYSRSASTSSSSYY